MSPRTIVVTTIACLFIAIACIITVTLIFDAVNTALEAPTGRGATYLVSASNAPAHVTAQADFVCDGTADESEINAAITAADGGTILLSKGTFYTSSPIVLVPGTKLIGQGGGSITKIYLTNGSDCDVILYKETESTARWLYIGYIVINGNKDNQTAGHGIHFDGTEARVWDFEIERVFTVHCYQDGMRFDTVWGGHIHNNNSEYNGRHGYYLSGIQCHLDANYSQSNLDSGFYLSGRYNNINGIEDQGSATGVECNALYHCVLNNIVTQAPTGDNIHVNESWYNTFSNLKIVQGTSYGLYIKKSSGDQFVGGNIVGNSGSTFSRGIYGYESNNIDISHFCINDCMTGIYLASNTTNFLVSYCNFDLSDVTTPANNLGAATNSIKNCDHYIAPGETRDISVAITAGAQNTVTSIQNTFGNDVLITEAFITIITADPDDAPTYNMGTDDDGSGAPSVGNNLFDAIPDTAGYYRSVSNGLGGDTSGVQTQPVLWQATGNDWVNFIITDDAGDGTVGTIYITVIGA